MSDVSPTLVPGQRYLSVIAEVPSALGGRIRTWQQAHGTAAEQAHSHITVWVGEKPACCAVERLQDVVGQLEPVEVGVGAPATFLPESAVSYLRIERGRGRLEELHRLLSDVLGVSASPFPYVPHVTLAMRMEESVLLESLEDFSDLPDEETSFRIDRLQLYSFEGERWSYVGTVNLADSAGSQRV